MQLWCTTDEVDDLVRGSPSPEMLQRHAEHATSLLYDLSGRAFAGEGTVQASFVVGRRGYVKLNDWQPVRAIASATVDGEDASAALSPAGSYAIVDRTYAGKTLVLVLDVGQNPPTSGRRAAASLAAEMLRGDPGYATTSGADDVRLPFRVTSVTRQGVSYTYANPSDSTKEGLTGLYEVDLFLRAVNPGTSRTQPKVVPL